MLTINLNDLTENQKEWLFNIFNDDADTVYNVAMNERLWAKNISDKEQAKIHEQDAEEERQYGAFLSAIAYKIEAGENISLNLSDLTEKQIEWFRLMLSEYADDAMKTASNEHLWALGANDNEQATMHEMNSDEQRAYASFLNNLATKIEMGGND